MRSGKICTGLLVFMGSAALSTSAWVTNDASLFTSTHLQFLCGNIHPATGHDRVGLSALWSGGIIDEESTPDGDSSRSNWVSPKFVTKHNPNDKVALVGGNPSRRRKSLERKLRPYELLDLYGSPRDVGPSDTNNLIKKIRKGAYDVVYSWTRFNSHNARSSIRDACGETGTRFVEVESLAHIVPADTTMEPGTE